MRKIRENNDDLNEEKNSKTNSQSKEQKKKIFIFQLLFFSSFLAFQMQFKKII